MTGLIPAWVLVVGLVVLVLALLGMWLSGLATRLNRLHIRTDSARLSLEGALMSRSGVIAVLQPELAASLGRASSVALRPTDMDARSDAENAVLRHLDPAVLTHPGFVEASTKVDLAARFYNDAVADTRLVRQRAVVRVFRLSGSAPLPEYYEGLAAGGQD